jgi:hypothetical protein
MNFHGKFRVWRRLGQSRAGGGIGENQPGNGKARQRGIWLHGTTSIEIAAAPKLG